MLDWQTDEDAVWDESEEKPTEPPQPQRRWQIVLGLLALLLLSGSLIGYQLRQRAAAVSEAIKEDVLASDSLLRTAAAQQDRELFVSLLSGRDTAWTEAQLDLLAQDLLFADAVRPLGLQAQAEQQAVIDLDLAPELDEAYLVAQQQYTLNDPQTDEPRTVTLQQTFVYRRGQTHWLLSPPDESFWGRLIISRGRYLTVSYSERESDIGRQLAADLETAVVRLCNREEGLQCPEDLILEVEFSPDPESLLQLAAPKFILSSETKLQLPSPALIGEPVDETGYQALLRGYSAYVLAVTLNNLVAWECCRYGAVYQAMLEQRLSELGVWDWPLQPSAYGELIDAPPLSTRLRAAWDAPDPAALSNAERLAIYALVDYLSTTDQLMALKGDSFADQVATLTSSIGYWGWLSQAFDSFVNPRRRLDNELEQFIYNQVETAPDALAAIPPEDWPEQDILLYCEEATKSLYRYRFAADSWQWERNFELDTVTVAPLPDDSGIFFSGLSESVQFARAILRQGEDELMIANQDSDIFFFPAWPVAQDPTSRNVLSVFVGQEGDEFGFALLDYGSCTAGECRWQPVPGVPVWSPEGRQVIVENFDENLLVYGNLATGQWRDVANGATPFWLDEETYAFFTGNSPGMNEVLYIASVYSHEPQLLLTTTDLLVAIPERQTVTYLDLDRMIVNPTDRRTAILFAGDRYLSVTHVFLLTRDDTATPWQEFALNGAEHGRLRVEWLFDMNTFYAVTVNDATFSQDGRYVVASVFSPGWNVAALLFDLEAEDTRFLGRVNQLSGSQMPDWSADGRWFVRLGDDFVDMIAPGAGAEGADLRKLVFHDKGNCSRVFWVNKLDSGGN